MISRDIKRRHRNSLKINVSRYGLINNFQKTISGNLGIVMEGNCGGADLKQKENVFLHIILVTNPLLANENNSVVYTRRRIRR